jgi:biopolymer transport protein ExbD
MAMEIKSGQSEEVMVEMNTTPLIDVLLVLLVMLIITIPIQTHAVKLDNPPPIPKPPPPIPPTIVNVEVDFDGTVYWNGSAVPDRATLDNYLRIEAAKPRELQSELHLKPNRLAKYGQVAVVLADAQRIGVTKIGFVGNEQYMEE